MVFSIELGWLPTTGRENVRNPVEAITYIHTLDTLCTEDLISLQKPSAI
ncbi:hypothetical protein PO124_28730 [Bacillus licheniformis]|nr:hypothetical protein [Bacillus licheniformis]